MKNGIYKIGLQLVSKTNYAGDKKRLDHLKVSFQNKNLLLSMV